MTNNYGRHPILEDPADFQSSEELRMDWNDAVNTIDDLVGFYGDYMKEYPTTSEIDRQDYEAVQRAWARIKQG
jgi:hypothetical protein